MGESNGTLQSIPLIRERLLCIDLFSLLIVFSRSAITHGISHLVGQVAVGALADLVLWKPENFGSKPEMVLKSGVIAWAQVRYQKSPRVHSLTRAVDGRCECIHSYRPTLLRAAHVGRTSGFSGTELGQFCFKGVH